MTAAEARATKALITAMEVADAAVTLTLKAIDAVDDAIVEAVPDGDRAYSGEMHRLVELKKRLERDLELNRQHLFLEWDDEVRP